MRESEMEVGDSSLPTMDNFFHKLWPAAVVRGIFNAYYVCYLK